MTAEKHPPDYQVEPSSDDLPTLASQVPKSSQTPEGMPMGPGEGLSRSEIRLNGRALKERWPISDSKRQEIVEMLIAVACDQTAKARSRIAAAKVLLEADKATLDWAKAEAGIDAEAVIRLEIKKAPGDDPGARILREMYRG